MIKRARAAVRWSAHIIPPRSGIIVRDLSRAVPRALQRGGGKAGVFSSVVREVCEAGWLQPWAGLSVGRAWLHCPVYVII